MLIAVCVLFVDMLRSMDFSEKEIDEIIEIVGLNAMFVLGRSIGMIGPRIGSKATQIRTRIRVFFPCMLPLKNTLVVCHPERM